MKKNKRWLVLAALLAAIGLGFTWAQGHTSPGPSRFPAQVNFPR